jgi:hypothetical protein
MKNPPWDSPAVRWVGVGDVRNVPTRSDVAIGHQVTARLDGTSVDLLIVEVEGSDSFAAKVLAFGGVLGTEFMGLSIDDVVLVPRAALWSAIA